MPLSVWEAQRRQELARQGLAESRASYFVDSEADCLNSTFNDLYYDRMAPQTTIDSFAQVLQEHDARCKAELLRRLGEGKSQLEQDELARQIGGIFSTSSHLETAGERCARVEPAPAKRRELVDRPDQQGRPQGPRRGDHVYDVPICDGLRAIIRDDPAVLDASKQAADSWTSARPGEPVTV